MKPTRLISPPGTYFVTFTAFQRKRLFVVESYARLFLKTLYGYRRQGRYALHAFVLMPDHIHLLFTPEGDTTLERGVQLIKGGYSHAVGVEIRRREIWQKGFTDHRIRDAQDFAGTSFTFIRIRWWGSWLGTRLSIVTALRSPDSNWMRGPQRLKPSSRLELERHDWKSCPSRFCSGPVKSFRLIRIGEGTNRTWLPTQIQGKGTTSSRTANARPETTASAAGAT